MTTPSNTNGKTVEVLYAEIERARLSMPRVRYFDDRSEGIGTILDIAPHGYYTHTCVVRWADGRIDTSVPLSWLVMVEN
jgi:hypothetical protein